MTRSTYSLSKDDAKFLLRSFGSRRSLIRVPETTKAFEEADDTINAQILKDCNETLFDLASGSNMFQSDDENLENNLNISVADSQVSDDKLIGTGRFCQVHKCHLRSRDLMFRSQTDERKTLSRRASTSILPVKNEPLPGNTSMAKVQKSGHNCEMQTPPIEINLETLRTTSKRPSLADILQFSSFTLSTSGSSHSINTSHHNSSSTSVVKHCYAVKTLRTDIPHEIRKKGAIDLVREARFLQALSHRNIISLIGLSGTLGCMDYTLVLPRLKKNLSSKIVTWNAQMAMLKSRKLTKRKTVNFALEQLFNERVAVALEIASALKYLHDNNIIHRDICPPNIGFDYDDTMKLFDFGFAKELKPKDQVGLNQYLATQITVNGFYVAPEIYFREKSYGKPADVYSFGILFWQLLHLSTPFPGIDAPHHIEGIYKESIRPTLKRSWPRLIKSLISAAWDSNPSYRLCCYTICEKLKKHLAGQEMVMM